MNALLEAFQKADSGKLDELEAMEFGVPVAKFSMLKQGYLDTYTIVDETFEKGFKMPKRRKLSLQQQFSLWRG